MLSFPALSLAVAPLFVPVVIVVVLIPAAPSLAILAFVVVVPVAASARATLVIADYDDALPAILSTPPILTDPE